MITRFLRAEDCFRPDDLVMLQRVLDDLCKDCLLSHRSAAADELAKQIIRLYKAGARDPEKIVSILGVRLRRPTG